MYLRIIVLILFACETFCDSDDQFADNQYIDQLPEVEKDELLHQIARRITDEVKPIQGEITYKSGETIPDKELDKHKEYVSKVFKEELANLRRRHMLRQGGPSTVANDQNTTQGNLNIKNENAKLSDIKPSSETLNPVTTLFKQNNKASIKSIDTTNIAREGKEYTIPVQVIYDATSPTTENQKTEKVNSNEAAEKIAADKKDADGSYRDETRRQANPADVNLNITSTDKTPQPSQAQETTTTIVSSTDYVKNRPTSTSATSVQNKTTAFTSVVPALRSNNNDTSAKDSSLKTETQTEILKLVTQLNSSQGNTDGLNSKATQEAIQNANNDTTTTAAMVMTATTSTPKAYNNAKEDTLSLRIDNQSINKSESVHLTSVPVTVQSVNKIESSTVKNAKELNVTFYKANIETDKNSTHLVETNALYTVKENKTYEVFEFLPNEVPFVADTNKVVKQNSNLAVDPKLVTEMSTTKPVEEQAKVLSQRSDPKEKKDGPIKLSYEDAVSSESTKKEDLQGLGNNRDDPTYYVPVYNYAPENAYYNPSNRFELNEGDVQAKPSLDLGGSALRQNPASYEEREINHDDQKILKDISKSDLRTLSAIKEPNLEHKRENNVELKYYMYQEPKSHLNTDDDSSAQLKKQVGDDSAELNEPDNYVREPSLKKTLGMIRDILYSRNEKKEKKKINHKKKRLNQLSRNKYTRDEGSFTPQPKNRIIKLPKLGNSIDLDYYFGRFNGKVDSKENFTPKKQKYPKIFILKDGYRKSTNEPREISLQELKDVVSMTPATDAVPVLIKLEAMLKKKSETKRSGSRIGNEMDSFIETMMAMIVNDDKSLYKYDWLSTTVAIRSALEKMREMISLLRNGGTLLSFDKQLLSYIVYMYKESERDLLTVIQRSRGVIGGKDAETRIMRQLNRIFLRAGNAILDPDLNDFDTFLKNVEQHLFQPHNAIKHIALVSTAKTADFFRNLRELYLSEMGRKEVLQLLLHFSMARLFQMMDRSAKEGAMFDYQKYVSENRKTIEDTKEEFIFALKFLFELKKLKK